MALRKKKANSGATRSKLAIEHHGFYPYFLHYMDRAKIEGVSKDTIRRRDSAIRRFIQWCDERSLNDPREITKPILERYQRYLYYYRKKNGEPLSMGSQNVITSPLKSFFKWLTQENYLTSNPASELVLPKKPKQLPRTILSVDDIHSLLSQPDIATPEGFRDRVVLEILYASGIRRSEASGLDDRDIDYRRNTLLVRQGKGNKDRYLPLSERCSDWIQRYQHDIRPQLLTRHDEPALFLTDYGVRITDGYLGHMTKRYLEQAGIHVDGSCHLLRHAMATHMLENGADIRFIQSMLGHSDLTSTEIYTRVSINQLQSIYAATHPLADMHSILSHNKGQ